eukprot:UN05099
MTPSHNARIQRVGNQWRLIIPKNSDEDNFEDTSNLDNGDTAEIFSTRRGTWLKGTVTDVESVEDDKKFMISCQDPTTGRRFLERGDESNTMRYNNDRDVDVPTYTQYKFQFKSELNPHVRLSQQTEWTDYS